MNITISEEIIKKIKNITSCKRLGLQAFDMESNKGYTADILDVLKELKELVK